MDRKSVFIIAAATLVTIVIWVIANVWHARANVSVSPDIQKAIEPLDPNFDKDALNFLE